MRPCRCTSPSGPLRFDHLYHLQESMVPSPFPTSLTFLHGGALFAGHVKLQGGVSGWRGQVQASSFISTNETDSDSEALPWAPNHGLHCCCYHCVRVGVRGEERRQGRAGTRGRGTLGTGGEVRGGGRAELGEWAPYPGCWHRNCSARCLSAGTASGRGQLVHLEGERCLRRVTYPAGRKDHFPYQSH